MAPALQKPPREPPVAPGAWGRADATATSAELGKVARKSGSESLKTPIRPSFGTAVTRWLELLAVVSELRSDDLWS